MEEDRQEPSKGLNMTGLLTVAAVFATLLLLVSAANTGSTATASDSLKRGNWGIANWTSDRRRPLNPHERRWQTSILSGKDNESRWRDLVAEVEYLERLSNFDSDDTCPDSFSGGWLEAKITNLENSLEPLDPGATSP